MSQNHLQRRLGSASLISVMDNESDSESGTVGIVDDGWDGWD